MPEIKTVNADRDVILGDQHNYWKVDLERVEDLLSQIVALLRQPETSIQIGGKLHDSVLVVGSDNQIEINRAAFGAFGKLRAGADSRRCNSNEGQVYETTPVGLYPGGVSPFGLWEPTGNVWEWTASWYQAYPGSASQADAYGETRRVVRGGSWNNFRYFVRCAYRFGFVPDYFYYGLGFRLVSPGSD